MSGSKPVAPAPGKARGNKRSKPLTQVAEPSPAEPSQPSRRDRRPQIYAGLDLAFAALHGVLVTQVALTRHASGQLLLWSIVVAFAVAGVASLAGRPWGWRIAAFACGFLIAVEVVLLIVIVASAAYLAGVFGAIGQGAAAISLAAGALTIQLVALVPALQLKYLLTRAGRRAFGVARG